MLKNMPIQRGTPSKHAVSDQLLKVNLGKEAVKMALCSDWTRAVELNQAILELCPDNCEAANRLAKALMELVRYQEAREVLEDLCRRSPRQCYRPQKPGARKQPGNQFARSATFGDEIISYY